MKHFLIVMLMLLSTSEIESWRRRRRRSCRVVNCSWGSWGSYGSCSAQCGGGTQTRSRSKAAIAACGGRDCYGSYTSSKSCNTQCCPVNCVWGSWGSYGSCSAQCGGGTQTKSRSKAIYAACGGRNCYGSYTSSKSCNTQCCPVNCVWGAWGSYGPCSAQCGGGIQVKSRYRATALSCGGKDCPGSSTSSRSCNTQCCPVNCAWGAWGSYGSCSAQCGGGIQVRSRSKATLLSCGGKDCPGSSTSSQSCNTQCCPVNCAWGSWGNYGSCSAKCGGGTQVRSRSKATTLSCGGKDCPGSSTSSRSCNTQCCPVNCAWGAWGSYGSCSAQCGGGIQVRSRSKATSLSCGGKDCPGSSTSSQSCNTQCCPVNCAWGTWGNYGSCSAKCGGGTQVRSRSKATSLSCGGEDCPGSSTSSRSCNTQCCPVNCTWGAWGNYGSCSAKCGGGTQVRSRSKATSLSCGGEDCPGSSTSSRSCNTQCCPVNCTWGAWGNYGSCSAKCGGGTQVRSRSKATSLSCGGKDCPGSSTSSRLCNTQCCPVNCVWGAWGSYGSCSAQCGGGTQVRSRPKATTLSCGGKDCPGSSNSSRSCNTQCCPLNCAWGAWGEYGSCSAQCGGGTQVRFRNKSQIAYCGGNDCIGTNTESTTCNDLCCPVNCIWDKWSEWEACSQTCGGGRQSRTRKHKILVSCNGTSCVGPISESRLCNEECCKVNCQWNSWQTWSQCTKSCGKGLRNRTRTNLVAASCGGDSCNDTSVEFESCNDICCPLNCSWSKWGPWGECTKTCGNGTQVRNRVEKGSFCGGRNCTGRRHEKRVCTPQCCPVDCKWSTWSNWSSCSTTCGDGNRVRNRKVYVKQSCGGKPCHENETQIIICNEGFCPVDCAINNTWGSWSKCSHECGAVGMRYRIKEILVNSSNGGKVCPSNLTDVEPCNRVCYNDGMAANNTCYCAEGWRGECCDIDEDECTENTSQCDENALCSNTVGSYNCTCANGYQGNGLECKDLNECVEPETEGSNGDGVCGENSICVNNNGSFDCICKNGFRWNGDHCVDIDECVRRIKTDVADSSIDEGSGSGSGDGKPHNATYNICTPNSTCVNNPGGYECVCHIGFDKNKHGKCIDQDECANEQHTCTGHGQHCENYPGAYRCVCNEYMDMVNGECEERAPPSGQVSNVMAFIQDYKIYIIIGLSVLVVLGIIFISVRVSKKRKVVATIATAEPTVDVAFDNTLYCPDTPQRNE